MPVRCCVESTSDLEKEAGYSHVGVSLFKFPGCEAIRISITNIMLVAFNWAILCADFYLIAVCMLFFCEKLDLFFCSVISLR